MSIKHIVKQGECLSSIAEKYGFWPDTIANFSANIELKKKRENLNILLPGDSCSIPDRNTKEEVCSTEQLHTFIRKGVPAKIRLRIMDDDEPRSNEPYVMEIDGVLFRGMTDEDGRIEHFISPGAQKGKLIVGDSRDEFLLSLGYLDPLDEICGVQARLTNLGYNCGDVAGNLTPETQQAIKQFQRDNDLDLTGEIDDATRDKLKQVYGV